MNMENTYSKYLPTNISEVDDKKAIYSYADYDIKRG
jgi:hypothetical protein